MAFQEQPNEVAWNRHKFSGREVGLTHPDKPSFVKLNDAGAIELFAKLGIGIYIDAASGSIVLVADNIKFLTREEGLHWNQLTFNSKATKYVEPAFVPYGYHETVTLYAGLNNFLEDEE